MVCPHAVIRSKVYEESLLEGAPASFKSRDARLPEWKGLNYTLQVAVEDCTGCGICVDVCPARNKSEARLKAINMQAAAAAARNRTRELGFFPLHSGAGSAPGCRSATCAKCRCNSRSSSSPARARAAARRPTSSCSPSFSATGCSSPTRPVVRRSTAAICRPRPTRRTATVAARPGRIRCLRTTPSSASDSAFRSTSSSEFAAELLQQLAPVVGDKLAQEILDAPQTR